MIISNTSTLILLAKSGLLNIFLDENKNIAIPNIVYKELLAKEKSFEVLSIKKEVENKRIIICEIKKEECTRILNDFKLDLGEAAAYILFKKKNGRIILSDDKELIKLCRIENIPFVCAMAITVRLYKKKRLSKKDTLDKLESLYGYGRYSKEIYNFFKQKVE